MYQLWCLFETHTFCRNCTKHIRDEPYIYVMAASGGNESAKRARNEEDVGDPLPDDELQEEQEEEGSEDDDGGGSDAGAEDLSTDPVRPILLASQYGTNTPTSNGARRLSLDARGILASIKRIKCTGPREVGSNNAGELRKVSDVTCSSTLPQQSPSAPMLHQPTPLLGGFGTHPRVHQLLATACRHARLEARRRLPYHRA